MGNTLARRTQLPDRSDNGPRVENIPSVDQNWELHRQRNARLPSSQLPPELWGEIMYLYRDMCSNLADSKKMFEPDLPPFLWIAVAQVCHQWRQTALGLPMLWTHIIDKNSKRSWKTNAVMIGEMLTRSKDCPMTFVYQGFSVNVYTIGLIIQHIHRFGRISIELRELLSFPTQLEPREIPFDTCPPPPILPDGKIPNIQELLLRLVAFRLYSPFLCRTMTNISLAKCWMKTLDCAVFLSSLQEMSGLLSLALEFIEITDYDLHHFSSQMPGVVQLRNLRGFRITMDNDASMVALLARIRVPHNARMSFRFRARPESYWLTPSLGEECIGVLDDFLASNLIGDMTPFRTVYLSTPDYDHDSGLVALWHNEPASKWPHYLSRYAPMDRKPDLMVSLSIWAAQATEPLRILCDHLPLSEVHAISVSTPHQVSKSSLWHGVLRRMKETRLLHLSMRQTMGIVYFLRALSKRSDMCPSLLFPQLERLVLSDVPIFPTLSPRDRRDYPNQMVFWLRKRVDRGLKVPMLEFKSVLNLTRSDIDEFRGCAEEIMWDGTGRIARHGYFEVEDQDDIEPYIFLDSSEAT